MCRRYADVPGKDQAGGIRGMPYWTAPEERVFCEHYVPGETAIHTLCDKCIKCCTCVKLPTSSELHRQAAEILEGIGGMIGELKEVVSKTDTQADTYPERPQDSIVRRGPRG